MLASRCRFHGICRLVTLLEGGHGEPDVHRPYGIEERLDEAIGLNAMFVAIGDQLLSYGAAKIPVKDEDFQMLLNMENDRVRASSYVIALLAAAGVLEVDGGRPNKVRLAARG